jgi:hypothetical protein
MCYVARRGTTISRRKEFSHSRSTKKLTKEDRLSTNTVFKSMATISNLLNPSLYILLTQAVTWYQASFITRKISGPRKT